MQADWLIIRAAGFADRKNVCVSTGLVPRFEGSSGMKLPC
jgi:hypothetical protein